MLTLAAPVLAFTDLTDLRPPRIFSERRPPARPPLPEGAAQFPIAADRFARRVDAMTGAPVRASGPEVCSVRTNSAGDAVGPDGIRSDDGSLEFVPGSWADVTPEARVNIDNGTPSEGNCLLWAVAPLDPDGPRILRSPEAVARSQAADQNLLHALCAIGFYSAVGPCDLASTNRGAIRERVAGVLTGVGESATAAIAIRGWQSLRLSLGPPRVQDSTTVSVDPNSVSALRYQLTPALTLTHPAGVLPPQFVFSDTQQAVSRQIDNLTGMFSNLSTAQKGLLGCGGNFASPCGPSDSLYFAQNANLADELGLDPNSSQRVPGGIDWLNASADVLLQELALTRASASDAPVGKRDSGPNVEPSTGLAHETGVTTQTFATQDLDGDGLPDLASYLRVSIAGTNVTADRLQVAGGELTVDGTTPVDGVAALLATDFRVEPFKYERDAAAEAALGVPVFYKDPRGADGSLGTGDDPLTRDAADEPVGENCATLGSPGTYRLTPDPGCTVLEIVSANLQRLVITNQIKGPDEVFDPPETLIELQNMLDADPGTDLFGDPISGADGIVFANWIEQEQQNASGELLGLYGFRSDNPAGPIDFGQPVDEIVATSVGQGTELGDIVFQLERYQKAANLDLEAFSLFDPDWADPFANQCAGAPGGVCYRMLAGSASDPIVGALPAGYQVFEIVPAPDGPGTGNTSIQTSAITGQPVAVATPAGDFAQVPLTLPLQRLNPLEVGEVAALEESPDTTAVTAAVATVTYLDPDTLELREDVLVMENRRILSGFFCPPGAARCYGPSQTASLFELDVDRDYFRDLDENHAWQLDFLDDGTPGPATDDVVTCGSGIPGDVLQQLLSAELSAAELESLPSVLPSGVPVRSPGGCPLLLDLMAVTADDGEGSRPFAWHSGEAVPDADGDAVPDGEDLCPKARDALQEDSGGVGLASAPDGNGDACQCGDVSNDGRVTLADFVQIRTWVASGGTVPPSPEFAAEKCDVGGSEGCSLADFVLVAKAASSSDPALIQQVCEAAAGSP